MTNGKRLCLNMIVKNEMANLERCLAALAPDIQRWVIGDTGSTDGTQDFVMAFFAARGLSGEPHSFPFREFRAGAQHARAAFRLPLLAAIHPQIGQFLEDLFRSDHRAHYGFLHTWPRRASMSSAALGPHVPAA